MNMGSSHLVHALNGWICLWIVSFSLYGCMMHSEVSVNELQQYLLDRENGLSPLSVNGDVVVQLVYKPSELVAAQICDCSEGQRIDSILRGIGDAKYFLLLLSKKGRPLDEYFVGQPTLYTSIHRYLNDEIAKDVYLFMDDSKLPAVETHFLPGYGMSKSASVMLIFDVSMLEGRGGFEVVVDIGRFGVGKHSFTFSTSDIEKVPRLRRSN